MSISKHRFISMWILAIVVLVITGTCGLVRAEIDCELYKDNLPVYNQCVESNTILDTIIRDSKVNSLEAKHEALLDWARFLNSEMVKLYREIYDLKNTVNDLEWRIEYKIKSLESDILNLK